MTDSALWLRRFRENRERPSPGLDAGVAIDGSLRGALVRSLGRFYLGESGEGRVAHQAASSRDPALDDSLRECVALYVREEHRHAAEIARVLRALGAAPPARHWSDAIFRRGRRLLGLRTKMMTIAAAEVVGIVFYRMLRDGVPALSELAGAIARDEERHLDFQVDYFARVAATGSALAGPAAAAGFALLVACAWATFVADHGPLLRQLHVSRAEVGRRVVREAVQSARAAVLRAGERRRGEACA